MTDGKRMMKAMLLGGVAAFAFVFVMEILVHAVLMKGLYESTVSVWRPMAEANMAVNLLSQLLFAMAVAFFYPVIGPDLECKKAVPFGIGLGLVLAAPQLATFYYLPIPISISLAWAGTAFVKAFGSAFIVAKVFGKLGAATESTGS